MSLLTATHLPLLIAKFEELKALHLTLTYSAPSTVRSEVFKRHYDAENGLNKFEYRKECDDIDATYQAAKDLNYIKIEDLRVAIVECRKHISITNALNLIGE